MGVFGGGAGKDERLEIAIRLPWLVQRSEFKTLIARLRNFKGTESKRRHSAPSLDGSLPCLTATVSRSLEVEPNGRRRATEQLSFPPSLVLQTTDPQLRTDPLGYTGPSPHACAADVWVKISRERRDPKFRRYDRPEVHKSEANAKPPSH